MTDQMDLDIRLRISYDCDPAAVEEALRSLVSRGTVMEPIHAGLELAELDAVIIGQEVRSRFSSYAPILVDLSPPAIREHFSGDSERLNDDSELTMQEAANVLGDDDLFLAADKIVGASDLAAELRIDLSAQIVRHAAREAGVDRAQ